MIFLHQFIIVGKQAKGSVQFVQNLRPGLEFNPSFRLITSDEARDEGRNDTGSPLEQVFSHQGIDQSAFARFDRSHHGNPQERVCE